MNKENITILSQSPLLYKGFYKHYKGNYYSVLAVVRHSETLEPLVLYQALYGDRGLWVRPLAMFVQTVVLDGISTDRFTFISHTIPNEYL